MENTHEVGQIKQDIVNIIFGTPVVDAPAKITTYLESIGNNIPINTIKITENREEGDLPVNVVTEIVKHNDNGRITYLLEKYPREAM